MGVDVNYRSYNLIHGDTIAALRGMSGGFDLIFADPPYFLSKEGGTTCKGGKRVSVDKVEWDRPKTPDEMHEWNRQWLTEAVRLLAPHGSLWVSGTHHNIHSVGFALQQLGLEIVNDITWVKKNPPPNLGRRSFVHATETLIWAVRPGAKYTFDYAAMKAVTGKQMRSDWNDIGRPSKAETAEGKHPTQKPQLLLRRIIAACCSGSSDILDPFCGSGTTGVEAAYAGHRFTGIDNHKPYLDLAERRIQTMLYYRLRGLEGVAL